MYGGQGYFQYAVRISRSKNSNPEKQVLKMYQAEVGYLKSTMRMKSLEDVVDDENEVTRTETETAHHK